MCHPFRMALYLSPLFAQPSLFHGLPVPLHLKKHSLNFFQNTVRYDMILVEYCPPVCAIMGCIARVWQRFLLVFNLYQRNGCHQATIYALKTCSYRVDMTIWCIRLRCDYYLAVFVRCTCIVYMSRK